MAVTHDLINHRLTKCRFVYFDGVSSSKTGGGEINLSRNQDPFFRVEIETKPIRLPERMKWIGWLMGLRGGVELIKTHDITKKPQAYVSHNSSESIQSGWDGNADLATIASGGGSISLAQLPSGYQFKAGDPIGLSENGRYGYYIITNDVTAVGTGATGIITEPRIPTTIFSTQATAHLWRPEATFIIDSTSWQDGGDNTLAPVSFTATQRL